MFNWLRRLLNNIEITPVDSPLVSEHSIAKECERTKETIKRVAAVFEEQAEQIQTMALKPHDPTCEDPLTCTKEICFIFVPDKIVSTEVVKVPQARLEILARAKKEFKHSSIAPSKKVSNKKNRISDNT